VAIRCCRIRSCLQRSCFLASRNARGVWSDPNSRQPSEIAGADPEAKDLASVKVALICSFRLSGRLEVAENDPAREAHFLPTRFHAIRR
jgi:hypothetical protein